MRALTRKLGTGALMLALVSLGPVAASPAGPRAATPQDVLDRLDMAYVEEVTEHLTTIGSTPDGWRVFGTPEDLETAGYLAQEMSDMGLENVGLEPVPGDAWVFKGASVEVDGGGIDRTFKAASVGGVPGTPPGGISGEVEFVGYGTRPEYRGKDVEGKIVFAWWDFEGHDTWPNNIAEEAKVHGAKAAIIASGSPWWYSAGNGRALGSNDGECSTTLCVPLVTISKVHARKLVRGIRSGTVQGNVTLNAHNEFDATGYNTYGEIPGSTYPERVIVFAAHHDAWFTSAADNSVGTAMMMAVAKAVKDSGYQPEYTWVFGTVTGEEYGLADSYFDWLRGGFIRITEAHPEWQENAVAILNWELHSPPYHLGVNVPRELAAFTGASLDKSVGKGMVSSYGLSDINSWDDGFTYNGAGAPALTIGASNLRYWSRYHTDYDSLETLDFVSLEPVFAAEAQIALDLDHEMLPYDFGPRLSHLAARLDYAAMDRFGGDSAAVAQAYDDLAAAWGAAAGAAPSVCARDRLREATRISLDEFTAMALDEGVFYSHEQAQKDVVNLSAAIRALRAGTWRTALRNIRQVGIGFYLELLSKEPYDVERLFRDPAYPKLSWGVQAQLPPIPDHWDLYRSIRAKGRQHVGDFTAEIAQLKADLASQTVVYRSRLDQITGAMERISTELDAVATC